MDKVEIFRMVDESDLLIEIDICSASKNTECLAKLAEVEYLDGFKRVFFTDQGNRFVTEGEEPGEFFEEDHPTLTTKEIEIVLCKDNEIQVHRVPAEVDDFGGYITKEVYTFMVKTDKFFVEKIKVGN